MSRLLYNGDYQITQKYKKLTHKGIDIVKYKSKTCEIKAHTDGQVVMIQTGQKNNKNAKGNASYGNFVKMKHKDGYYTLYAHLKDVYVKKGDKLKQGDFVGYMGNTGRSFGAHLHFEVRNTKDNRIDPTIYLTEDLPITNKKYIEIEAKSGVWCRKGVGFKYKKYKVIPYKTICELLKKDAGTSNGYKWDKIVYENEKVYVPNKWNKYL